MLTVLERLEKNVTQIRKKNPQTVLSGWVGGEAAVAGRRLGVGVGGGGSLLCSLCDGNGRATGSTGTFGCKLTSNRLKIKRTT